MSCSNDFIACTNENPVLADESNLFSNFLMVIFTICHCFKIHTLTLVNVFFVPRSHRTCERMTFQRIKVTKTVLAAINLLEAYK